MSRKRSGHRRRFARRLVVGGVIGAGVIFGLSQAASAAVTAQFSPSSGVLTVFGDNLNNNIEISRNAAGVILINGGAVQVSGGTATVANVSLIQVFGQGGNDTITLNEAFGALPRANLFGGAGNDVLTGGSGGDQLFGQAGNDTLLGKGGFDFLFGGSENDTLTGGDDDDQVFGESNNDRMIWNPGDDTDLNEGGAGDDTVEVNGGNAAEAFTTTANGTRVRFDRLDPAPFSIDVGTSENLVLNANGGNDSFSATGDLAALIKITVDGGAGDDTILGSNGADQLIGRCRQRLRRRPAGQRRRVPGRRRRRLPVGSGRRQRHRRGPGRHRPDGCSTAAAAPRSSRRPPTAAGCGSPATSAPSSWTSTTSKSSI